MKVRELAGVMTAYAEFFEHFGSNEAGKKLRSFAAMLGNAGTGPVGAMLKSLGPGATPPPSPSPTLREIAALLEPLARLLVPSGKTGVLSDLAALSAFMERHADVEVASLTIGGGVKKPRKAAAKASAAPPREDVVESYVRALTRGVDDEAVFATALGELQGGAVSGPELLLVAKKFAGAAVRTKPSALKNIRAHRDQLRLIDAKTAATAGRTAA